MSATAPITTTLTAAITDRQTTVPVAVATSIVAGSVIAIGAELALVQGVAGLNLSVERGQQGTQAVAHASGTTVYAGAASVFKSVAMYNLGQSRVAMDASQGVLPDLLLPTGSRVIDPNTGYEYIVVDCQSAFVLGEWVGIDGTGLATSIAATTKGRVGIIVETIGSSDTLALAMVVGTFASALFSSSVTTATAQLLAGVQYPDAGTSTGGNVIFNASCTVAPSTATSPGGLTSAGVGTAYVYNPWCYGATVDIVP